MAAAGVLIRDGRSDCSAVLIAPSFVLTAAHCVSGKTLVTEGGESTIAFRTGAYPGHPTVTRQAEQRMMHPLYQAAQDLPVHPTSSDIALLRLAEPVPDDVATPIQPGPPVALGENVLIASYPGGQGQRARERRCNAALANEILARLECLVKPGESGSPVVRTEGGLELAAIVVATSQVTGHPLAITVQVETRLRQLRAVYGPFTP